MYLMYFSDTVFIDTLCWSRLDSMVGSKGLMRVPSVSVGLRERFLYTLARFVNTRSVVDSDSIGLTKITRSKRYKRSAD